MSLLNGVDILGPVSSPIFKIKNKYRTRLLLRSKSNVLIQKDIDAELLKKEIPNYNSNDVKFIGDSKSLQLGLQ